MQSEKTATAERAKSLLKDPQFLYRASLKISSLGVVGEERNRLIVFLAGITKELEQPVSVLVKGPSSSGKSNLVRTALELFPTDSVIERASLSAKAPVHSDESLGKKILFIQEYRGGKDAQLLIRLLQSEGRIAHEYTSMVGRHRGTHVAEKVGTPVVITTTTDSRVYPDDETRFLSLHVDESAAQNLAIVKAQVHRESSTIRPALKIWRCALASMTRGEEDFQAPPAWLEYVAENLPLDKVRVRRDWKRFLSLCSSCALLRPHPLKEPRNITFEDYAVAYRILEPAFAATANGLHPRELAVIRAVEQLRRSPKQKMTVHDLAEHLGWKEALVYKYVRLAIQSNHLAFEDGTQERNRKFIVARSDRSEGFLPHPLRVFGANKDIGPSVTYIDPLTGTPKTMRRD